MASWDEVEAEAPDIATRARGIFDARVHKTLATLRHDGSPRISGIELIFAEGEAWFGCMPQSLKALDLLRDPRFALHSGTADPPDWEADAKIAGTAEEEIDPERKEAVVEGEKPPGPFHLFRLDITELVITGVEGDELVIESWHPGRGVERNARK
jgi:hypothetical protein